MQKILFVCSGNICRSPTAEGIFNKLVREAGLEGKLRAESAGTHGLHAGEAADPRARDMAARNGYDLASIMAREIDMATLGDYKLVVCMDKSHYDFVMERCHPNDELRVKLLMYYHSDPEREEVPDPYYGEEADFQLAFDLIEEACRGLLREIQAQVD